MQSIPIVFKGHSTSSLDSHRKSCSFKGKYSKYTDFALELGKDVIVEVVKAECQKKVEEFEKMMYKKLKNEITVIYKGLRGDVEITLNNYERIIGIAMDELANTLDLEPEERPYFIFDNR